MKIIIIGGSYAGIAAALAISQDSTMAVTVLALAEEKAATQFKEQLEISTIEWRQPVTITAIDWRQQQVRGTDTSEFTLSYDRLILAMTATGLAQELPGADLPGVQIVQPTVLNRSSHEKIAVVGAGWEGLRTLSELATPGRDLTLFESMDQLLFRYFDQEMVAVLAQELLDRGIHLHLGVTLERIEGSQQPSLCWQQERATFQEVFLALSGHPQVLTALPPELEQHMDQTILVNEYLETSLPNVFAIGDMVRFPLFFQENDYYLPLVNQSIQSGLVVAQNLLEPQKTVQPALRSVGGRLFNNYYSSVGLTESEARFMDISVKAVQLTQATPYLSIKLVFAPTGQLLGAQLVSANPLTALADLFVLAIHASTTVQQLANLDLVYYAPESQPLDFLTQLAWKAGALLES